MSKARLVVTAVIVEKRPVSEVARSYGVARSWVHTLLRRYQAEGEAAFEPRSRRPRTSPSAIAADTVELIAVLRKDLAGQGLDAGPHTIAWHLHHHHQVRVSAATVSRYRQRPHRSLPHRATPRPPTPPAPKPSPATGQPTPTTASAPTASTPTASSPSASAAASTTSASAGPTPGPPS
jgi:transposase